MTLNISSLANVAHLSPDHFSRLFTKEFGTTPLRYITNARMTKAKLLLATEDMTVAEISDFVGISDPAYFCRIFKKNIGMSPLEYRQKFNNNSNL